MTFFRPATELYQLLMEFRSAQSQTEINKIWERIQLHIARHAPAAAPASEREAVLEETLVKGLIVLESLHAAVDWELSDELKAAIADAVYAGRAVLTPAAPKEEPDEH